MPHELTLEMGDAGGEFSHPLSLLGDPRLYACSELEEPAEIVGVAPGLEDLPVHDPMDEGRRERLPSTTGEDPEEALLHAGVRRTHHDLVTLGDDIVDRPLLLDRADDPEELADPVRSTGEPRRTAVDRPGAVGHRADRLDPVFGDELEPPPSDRLALLDGSHGRPSLTA